MWPLALLGLGVFWYLHEKNKSAPIAAPPAAPPVDPNALIQQGMAYAMQAQTDEAVQTDPQPDPNSGGGGGSSTDGGAQVSVTSPVDPGTGTPLAPTAPAPPQALKMPVQAAQAVLQDTSARQLASRLQVPMGSLVKKRTL